MTQELKTFEVWHIENNGYNSDRYYNGEIHAENIDKAIEIFKNEWIKPEFVKDIDEDYQDEGLAYLNTGLEYYSHGEIITKEQIEGLEKEFDMDINDIIENYEGNHKIESLELGSLEHIYELKDPDSDPSSEDSETVLE